MARKKNIATFLGPQLGLSTIGSHAYAFSGQIQIDTSPVTPLLFTSGDTYLIGTVECIGPTLDSDPNNGQSALFLITLNGNEISTIKMDTENEDMPTLVSMPIVIPPRTEFKVTVDCGGDTSNMVSSCNIVGRIYDA